MEKSDFRLSLFERTYFVRSNLKGSNFLGSYFKVYIDTLNSDMTQCNFSYAKGLQNQTFTKTNLTSASFNGTSLVGTYFLECNLQGAQFIPILPAGEKPFLEELLFKFSLNDSNKLRCGSVTTYGKRESKSESSWSSLLFFVLEAMEVPLELPRFGIRELSYDSSLLN